MDYSQLLLQPNSPIQYQALIFLLGSLTVASLSDIKRMAAQTDFTQVWAAFTAIMFLSDLISGITGATTLPPFILKWALIMVFTIIASSTRAINISLMDVAALTALISTLPPALILAALTTALIANALLHPLLQRHGQGGAYPFLPTILITNLLTLAIINI